MTPRVLLKCIKNKQESCLIGKNYVILQSNMKKLLHIVFSLILSMLFILMASGVTFLHCSCSGKTTMTFGNATHDKGNTQSSKGCMTIATVSLSPTTQMQPAAFDFHAFQPLVAIINDWRLPSLVSTPLASTISVLPQKAVSPPPRQYLQLIRVLII